MSRLHKKMSQFNYLNKDKVIVNGLKRIRDLKLPKFGHLNKSKLIVNIFKRFHNLKIAFKIISIVLFIATFMGGIGYTGYIFYQEQNSSINEMYASSLLSVNLLNESYADIRSIEALSLEMLLAPIEVIRQQTILNKIHKHENAFDTYLNSYATIAQNSYEAPRLEKLKEAITQYRAERQKAFDIVDQDIFDQATKSDAYYYYSTNALVYIDQIHIVLDDLIAYNNKAATKTIDQNNQDFRQASRILLILPFLAVIIALTIGIIVARLIAKPLQAMIKSVQQVASGNLAIEVQKSHSSNDETGQLADAFNIMTTNLRHLVSQVSQSSRLVTNSAEDLQSNTAENSSAAEQIVAAMSAAASDTEKQAVTINDASVAIQQVSASAQQIAATSSLVADLTEKTAITTKNGQKAIDKVVNQMSIIGERTEQIQKTITNLTLSNEQIRDIIKFIRGLAAQTNLLALNAAIEAARAGEHGRSFTVVAAEVRKLAEQSHEASQQISSLIHKNQDNINSTVSAMNAAANDVQEGINVVEIAGQAFSTNLEHIEQVSTQVREISSSIQQVAIGNQQIVDSIYSISSFSQVTAERVQSVTDTIAVQATTLSHMARESQDLTVIAQELLTAIQEFKL
ncbi:methyl-accepting chemotaxis protein [Desulfosporosinus sp. BICA1-9]|uniref:methyl-accepting chemotaxis protein n=1 Tax=Desulfosporosinus sp. BICA1-9 TaxID=1531958 RepID=UPI000AE405C5|nr:methyl-accepting chemotaxis protein [Desulfosporosinus sp. BICA1-9]HBW34682.1 methyl-accepting chemotaxis protein [Desulfosporosinus sp.]